MRNPVSANCTQHNGVQGIKEDYKKGKQKPVKTDEIKEEKNTNKLKKCNNEDGRDCCSRKGKQNCERKKKMRLITWTNRVSVDWELIDAVN